MYDLHSRKPRLFILPQISFTEQNSVRKQMSAATERALAAILRQSRRDSPILQSRLPQRKEARDNAISVFVPFELVVSSDRVPLEP